MALMQLVDQAAAPAVEDDAAEKKPARKTAAKSGAKAKSAAKPRARKAAAA
jgi:hypothetical protein